MGDEPSSPNSGDRQNPLELSARHDEFIKRLHALQDAFEQSTVEAAERYMRERDRLDYAYYGNYLDDDDDDDAESVWNLAEVLTRVATRVIPDGMILESLSETIEFYASHASIRPDGFVYVLEAGPYHKIGRSRDLTTRIRRLNIQLPFPVRCVAAFPCDDALRVEAELHKLFREHRGNGEWFTLPDEEPSKPGLSWLKNIRYATTGSSPYYSVYLGRGINANFHDEVPLAVQNEEAWRKAFAAAANAVDVGE